MIIPVAMFFDHFTNYVSKLRRSKRAHFFSLSVNFVLTTACTCATCLRCSHYRLSALLAGRVHALLFDTAPYGTAPSGNGMSRYTLMILSMVLRITGLGCCYCWVWVLETERITTIRMQNKTKGKTKGKKQKEYCHLSIHINDYLSFLEKMQRLLYIKSFKSV